MDVSNRKHAVGVFGTRQDADQALNELKASGFSMDKVSIIAKDVDEGERVADAQVSDHIGNQDVNTPTGAVADALTASTWGSVLVGLSSLALPGLGAVIAAGSVGTALVTSMAGIAVGAAATNNVVKALADLGIPEERARVYSDHLLNNEYLVIVDGTDDEIQRAEGTLKDRNIQYWGIYNSPQA